MSYDQYQYQYQPPVTSGPPAQPYAPQPGHYPLDPAPKNHPKWPYLLLAAAVLVLAGGIWSAYDRGLILKDSGIKACEALHEGSKTFTGAQTNDKPMTEQQYRDLRKVFADSRYADIKDHGTKLMDIVWQVSQMGADPGMGVLAYMGPLATQMTGLQSACADHGIMVTLQPAAASSAVPAATAGVPACTEVFTPGKTIPADFGGACLDRDGQSWSVMVMNCTDGREMYQVDAGSGAEPGWGFAGGKYRAGDTTAPSGKFAGALSDCYQ